MDSKDKKQLAKQRKEAARQAQKFHKEQEKQNKQSKKSSEKTKKKGSVSKIKEAVNAGRASKYENISREEKFRREGEEKLRNLQPHDFEDGYYIDEYSEKKRQEKRAKEIRKQENEVIHRNKKPMTSRQVRLKRILISAGIFTAVVIIGIILSLTVLFKTEKIDIEGDYYYTNEQIEAFSNVSLQQNIFLGAMNSTPEEIVDNLPYVESAVISFAIPDTITIKIRNAVPTYAVKDGNGYLVVSAKGRILDTVNFKTDDLIELKCGEIKDKSKGKYISIDGKDISELLEKIAKSLAVNEVENVTGLDISDPNNITIDYDNRIKINLGEFEDINYKIKTAFTIINEKLDPNGTRTVTGTLDVSACNKTKISHYKPSPTEATTVPSTTAPSDNQGDNAYNNNNYYDDPQNYYGGEDDNNNYVDGGAYVENGYNAYDGGEYAGNAYDAGAGDELNNDRQAE